MAETILRKKIANAIAEISSPEETRSAAYTGPRKITDAPIQVVIDANQGGLPILKRKLVQEVRSTSSSHDFEFFRVPLGEQWVLRGMSFWLNPSSLTDFDFFNVHWTLPGDQPIRDDIIIWSARVVDVDPTGPGEWWMGTGNNGYDFNGSGPNLSGAGLIGMRFGPGELVEVKADADNSIAMVANAVVDVVPDGVFVAI